MSKRSERLAYINNIADEVLIEILSRLHIEDVYSYKRVSKRWLNAISTYTEYFGKRYNIHHSRLALARSNFPRFALGFHRAEFFRFKLMIFQREQIQTYSFNNGATLSPPPDSKDFRVLSSHNGLVLCSILTMSSIIQYYVCNPLNKKWSPIPQPPSSCTKEARLVGFLCHAPFLSVTKDNIDSELDSADTRYTYRIVCLFDNLRAEIYVSETGEWTEYVLMDNTSYNLSLVEKDMACIPCNGLVYMKINNKGLFVIDPYKGRFGSIKLPDILDQEEKEIQVQVQFQGYGPYGGYNYFQTVRREEEKPCNYFFGECNGRLRCIHRYNRNGKLTIWELVQGDSNDIYSWNWFLIQEVDLLQFSYIHARSNEKHIDELRGFSSVVFHLFREDILYLCTSDKILTCDIVKKEFNDVGMITEKLKKAFPIVLPWWPLSEIKSHDAKPVYTCN